MPMRGGVAGGGALSLIFPMLHVDLIKGQMSLFLKTNVTCH